MNGPESFYIFIGAFVISSILIYRYSKFLLLIIIKMIYGKYSYMYMTTYKIAFIKSPFQYCFRDEFFSHVLFILDKKEEVPKFKTHFPINFENQPFFTSYKKFLKEKGKPYCLNAFSFVDPHFEIKVLGYQDKAASKKSITAYYFFNDMFFMGEYIFKETSKEIKNIWISNFA
jgi:hypothetical protein